MKITWLGHSCCQIETQGYTLLIDPFVRDNPSCTVELESLRPDFIVLTHGHADHYGDTDELAQRTKAVVISNFEIASYAQKKGAKIHPMHIGGSHVFPFGKLQLTIAHHGSSLPDGSYGGNPAGLLFTIEGKTIYHAGDTGLFGDMKLIGEKGLDLAILPIGDNFTMGPEDACRAVELLQPKQVVPVHYNTWEIINQNAEEWSLSVQQKTQTQVILWQPNQSLEL